MKKFTNIITLFLVCFSSLLLSAGLSSGNPFRSANSQSAGFITNNGQWPAEVKFLFRSPGMNAWITDFGIIYDQYGLSSENTTDNVLPAIFPEKMKSMIQHKNIHGQVVRMKYIGCNLNTTTTFINQKKYHFNYINKRYNLNKSISATLFGEIILNNLYPGISCRYYTENGHLRYDFLAEAGADLSKIRMQFSGADIVPPDSNGKIRIQTVAGEISIEKPFAWQLNSGKKKEIPCHFKLTGQNCAVFELGKFNPDLPLVIDPLVYSTFIGMDGDEQATCQVIDSNDNVYVAGHTFSPDYPTTIGAYDLTFNGGNTYPYDVFVSKLGHHGDSLIFSTFIGGDDGDYCYGMSLDRYNNIFLAGITWSLNFPVTPGAFSYNSPGFPDIFLSKLNTDGSGLVYSSRFGHSSGCFANSVAVDKHDCAYITGFTGSLSYPVTTGAYSTTFNGGTSDVFISKFDSAGSSLVYSTFIGGSGNNTNIDVGSDILVDDSGYAVVCGYTTSPDFPATANAFQKSLNGDKDVFILKMNPSGSKLIYSTFIGGTGTDACTKMVAGKNNSIFFTGTTNSTDFPVTTDAYNLYNNGNDDAFITQINDSGSKLLYSSFLGGGAFDEGGDIDLDSNGFIYLTGNTGSIDFPVTSGSFQPVFKGGKDAFLIKYDFLNKKMMYSSFLGGTNIDYGFSLNCLHSATVIISGCTRSDDYPVTTGAFCDSFSNGFATNNYDVMVSRLLPVRQAINVRFDNIKSNSAKCSWTKDKTANSAVFIIKSDTGTVFPLDEKTYVANDSFGLGSQSANNWYCIYNGNDSTVNIHGLAANTTYRVMVCEYLGSAGHEFYDHETDFKNPSNFITDFTNPDKQAHHLAFTNQTATTFTVGWINGNGTKRVAFIFAGSSGTVKPHDGISYTANSTFGKGSNASGWYCIYNGYSNFVNVKGLTANHSYRIMVCEYNGTSGKEYYDTSSAVLNPGNFTSLKTPEICLVTVNPLVNKNEILWKKDIPQGSIKFYHIYKEISTGTYSLLATVPYADTSLLRDNSSSPGTKSGSYKISLSDSSGDEYGPAFFQQSMCLTAANSGKDILLSWNAYVDESGSFVPDSYSIYRGISAAALSPFRQISSASTSFKDTSVHRIYYYMLATSRKQKCHNGNGISFTQSFSNVTKNDTFVNINENPAASGFTVSPNPFGEKLIIGIKIPLISGQLLLQDCSGKVVFSTGIRGEKEIDIDRAGLPAGIYFLIINSDSVIYKKIVVAK